MKKIEKTANTNLRKKAEELLKMKSSAGASLQHEIDAFKLIHELEVHQIELELQNEELMLAQSIAQESSDKYIELYDFAPTGYFTLNKNGVIKELNLMGAKMLGSDRSSLTDKQFSLFLSPDSKLLFNEYTKTVISSKVKESCELMMTENVITPLYVHVDSILSDNGEEFKLTFTDITQQKQSEIHQKESLEILQKIAASVPGVIYQYRLRKDGSSCFPFSSEAIKEIYRVSPEEVLEDASKVFEVLHPEDLPGVVESIQKSAKDLTIWNHEYRVKYNDGTIRTLLGTSLPQLESDGSVLWHGFITDISERKQIEEKLKESENMFSLFMDFLPAIVFMKDSQGKTLFSNKYMDNALGASEWMGKTMLEVFPNEFGEKLHADDQLSIRTGYQKIDESIMHVDGELHNYETQKFIIPRLDKEPYLGGISLDITDRLKAEENIQMKNKELAELNSTKDRFFSIIAHDLRSPLSGFMGLSKMMAEEMSNFTLTEMQNISSNMQKSAENLYQLLENLLDWSKMQKGITPFNSEKCDISLLAKQSIVILQDMADKKKIKIENNIAEATKVNADIPMLYTILRNLLSNALKFTQKGGLVEIGTTKFSDDSNSSKHCFFVKDSGIGMDSDLVQGLFKTDGKISRKGTEGELSTGLGLVLCKEFIEKHGGKIWAESEVGKGSTFYFSLPK